MKFVATTQVSSVTALSETNTTVTLQRQFTAHTTVSSNISSHCEPNEELTECSRQENQLCIDRRVKKCYSLYWYAAFHEMSNVRLQVCNIVVRWKSFGNCTRIDAQNGKSTTSYSL